MTTNELKAWAEERIRCDMPGELMHPHAAAVLALIAERDENHRKAQAFLRYGDDQAAKLRAAEADAKALREALRSALEGHADWREQARAALAAYREGR